MNPNGCECTLCTNYHRYKWATIMECKCGCHDRDEPSGHDGLCCEFPNGRRKENPYTDLKEAKYYKDILDKWEADNAL